VKSASEIARVNEPSFRRRKIVLSTPQNERQRKDKSQKIKKLSFIKKNLILSFKTRKRKGHKVISESECLKTYFVSIILRPYF
jgi:hypothetical protein